MSTATTNIRSSSSPNLRQAGPAPGGGALALATLDPVRLLKRYYPWLIAAAFVGAVGGAAAHFVLARVYPTFESTATFECRPPSISATESTTMVNSADDLSRFMMTQARIMTSTSVLEPATKNPDLEGSKWAKQFYKNGSFQPREAIEELGKNLSAKPLAQTTLVQLSLRWRDPDATRLVVDAVASAYLEEFRKNNNLDTAARREAIGRRIRDLETQITDKNRERDRRMAEANMTDLKEGQSMEETKARDLNASVVQLSRDLSTTESLLEKYTAMVSENINLVIPDDMKEESKRDPVVASLDQQLASLRVDERGLIAQGYGAEHPTVVSVRKRIEATQQERDEVFNTVSRRLFDSQIERLRTSKAATESQLMEVSKQLEEVTKRKEDLTRLRVTLDQIEEDVKRWTDERANLVQARNNLETLGSSDVYARVRQIQAAQRPTEMSFPKLTILVPLGVLLCTGLVGGVLVLREVLDQRVKGPADVAVLPRMRVLGMVPDASEDPVKAANLETAFRDAPTGVVSESFRQLRAPLSKAMDQAGHRTLLVLAGMPGSGATTVAANLALACAGAGERVLLIDANMRRPGMHRVFGLNEGPGLGDCLAGQTKMSDAIRASSAPNLSVLTAGTAANRMIPERLSSEIMGRLLAEAATNFDRVILDAPPVIVSGDGLALANRVDSVALVVRALSEKRGLVNRLRAQLSEAHGEFLGVIVNAVRSSAGGYFKGNIKATHEYQSQSQ